MVDMDKRVLVLDASMIRGAKKGFLRNLSSDYRFLLPDTLLHEIPTHALSERDTLTSEQSKELDAKIMAGLRRAMDEAGNNWAHHIEVMDWEMQTGLPGSDPSAPRCSLSSLDDIGSIFDETTKQGCLDYDESAAKMGFVQHSPADDEWFKQVRKLKPEDFLVQLRNKFASPVERSLILSETINLYSHRAKEIGIKLPSSFSPGPGYLGFGIQLSSILFLYWKLWKYGDEPADKKKPANPWLDQYYVGFMAIADGILSADKGQLERAWLCWPEKESLVFYYNQNDNSITRFQPEWSC